jgi:hypothetical protein
MLIIMAQVDGAKGNNLVHDPLMEDQPDSLEFIKINEEVLPSRKM